MDGMRSRVGHQTSSLMNAVCSKPTRVSVVLHLRRTAQGFCPNRALVLPGHQDRRLLRWSTRDSVSIAPCWTAWIIVLTRMPHSIQRKALKIFRSRIFISHLGRLLQPAVSSHPAAFNLTLTLLRYLHGRSILSNRLLLQHHSRLAIWDRMDIIRCFLRI